MGKDTSKPRMILVIGGKHAEDTIWLGDVEFRILDKFGIFAKAVNFFPACSVGVAKCIGTSTYDRSVFSVEFGVPNVVLAVQYGVHGGKVGACSDFGTGETSKGMEEEVEYYGPC